MTGTPRQPLSHRTRPNDERANHRGLKTGAQVTRGRSCIGLYALLRRPADPGRYMLVALSPALRPWRRDSGMGPFRRKHGEGGHPAASALSRIAVLRPSRGSSHPRLNALHGIWRDSKPISDLGTGAESQQIVATRPLYCLQYPVSSQSSAEDLT